MSKPRVLISGAGIAGTVLAFWLGKHGFEVVVLERAESQAQAAQGQIIDVEGPAQEIVVKMGLLEAIKQDVTHEAGLQFVDDADRKFGTLISGQTALSNDIEIQRPALIKILTEAAVKFPTVEFRYGKTVRSLRQTKEKVFVEILSRNDKMVKEESFDLLVACDGLRSATREMILDSNERQNALKPVDLFVAYFSVPAEAQDRPYWRVYNASGRRQLSLKPLSDVTTSAYACLGRPTPELRDARESRDVKRQKALVAEAFQGAGWECDRVFADMMKTENFYFEEISQVFLNRWSKGRCALVGDTAYAPSPLTGQGTNLAFIGAYALAAAIIQNPENHLQAFEVYEKNFRPYVNKTQPIPFGGKVTYLSLPLTIVGVWILRFVAWLILSSKIYRLIPLLGNVDYDLPDL